MADSPATLDLPTDYFAPAAVVLLHPLQRELRRRRAALLRRYAVEDVHALRAAARRLRAGLRLMRAELGPAVDPEVQLGLRALLEALSAARDGDVFLSLLRDAECVGLPQAHPDWAAYLEREERRLRPRRRQARDYLAAAECADLVRRLEESFAGDSALGAPDAGIGEELRDRLVRRTSQLLRRLASEARPHRRRSRAALHEFRRQCRRARYWAELLEPGLGKPARRLVRQLVKLTEPLGQMQDAELAMRRLARRRSWWAPRVHDRLRRRAAKAESVFGRRWQKLRRELADGLVG